MNELNGLSPELSDWLAV